MNNEKRENFLRAFFFGGLCRATCDCGKTFYNSDDDMIDWEDGEVEQMKIDGAIGVDFHLSMVSLQKKQYVDACDCWHPIADDFTRFLDHHAHSIADYLTAEKERKQREADRSPTVK